MQVANDARDREKPPRLLGGGALVLLGVGATIGTGIWVLTGTAAANEAGPAVVVSFAFAAVAAALAGLCYAELASLFPVAGSAYSYSRALLGKRRPGSSDGPWCSSTCSPQRPLRSVGPLTS